MSLVGDGATIAVDTPVWMESLLFGGSAEELIKLAITGRVDLVTSETLLAELADVLQVGLDYSDRAASEVLRFIRDCAAVTDDVGESPPALGRRPVLLEVARKASASCIATAESSPLSQLDEYEGIPVVTIG